MYEESYTFKWRLDNYERSILQQRIDNTKNYIRKCLTSDADSSEKFNKLKRLYSKLAVHENTFNAWKNEHPTEFRKKQKKQKKG